MEDEKEKKDTIKHTIPKVSSLGHGARWVNCILKVSG